MSNPFAVAGAPSSGREEIIWTENDTYHAPHPLTGKNKTFPRASAFGKILSDPEVLNMWKIAMAMIGVGKRRDIYALANSEEVPAVPYHERERGWWIPFYRIGQKAIDATDSASGSHEGTAVHRYTERYDAGTMKLSEVPPEWRPHMEQYIRLNTVYGRGMDNALRERRVMTLKLHNGVCGRLDALRPMKNRQHMLDDTKTGKQAPRGVDEIAIQEAIYANAEWMWEGDDFEGEWVPNKIDVNKTVASITWLPINDPENSQVLPVDIAWGWEAAKVAAWVRGYRNRAKRKNDGLILPIQAMMEEFSDRPDVLSPFGYISRMSLAETKEEISAIWLDAVADGEATKALEAAGHERLAWIRSQRESA